MQYIIKAHKQLIWMFVISTPSNSRFKTNLNNKWHFCTIKNITNLYYWWSQLLSIKLSSKHIRKFKLQLKGLVQRVLSIFRIHSDVNAFYISETLGFTSTLSYDIQWINIIIIWYSDMSIMCNQDIIPNYFLNITTISK